MYHRWEIGSWMEPGGNGGSVTQLVSSSPEFISRQSSFFPSIGGSSSQILSFNAPAFRVTIRLQGTWLKNVGGRRIVAFELSTIPCHATIVASVAPPVLFRKLRLVIPLFYSWPVDAREFSG